MARRSTSSGLGRGLGALLGDAVFEQERDNITHLSINKIQPNIDQPRKNFEPEALLSLSESIKQHGIIQPIVVRLMSSGYYQIISGERRWRAAKMAKLEEAPVIVIEADDKTAAELSLIENLQREDLNAIEEAQGYSKLMHDFDMTQEMVAKCVGKSRSAIANSVRLMGLPDDIRQLVEEDKLTAGHARAILSVSDEKARHSLAETILKDGLSVRQAEALANAMQKSGSASEDASSDEENAIEENKVDYVAVAANELTEKLGRKVKIVNGKRKGKIVLEYYGSDDLNSLLDVFKAMNI